MSSTTGTGRNRLKRLLRETFRLSGSALADLIGNYDWVLNARRSMLEVKLDSTAEDFQKLVARVARDEGRARREDGWSEL